MGKFMRKAKITRDVAAVVDLSQSSLGVRTRAKTLALLRLQSPTSPQPLNPNSSYLQLRSRRLEKPPLQKQLPSTNRKDSNPNPTLSRSPPNSASDGSPSDSIRVCSKEKEGCLSEKTILASKEDETEYNFDLGVEGSFGENNLDFDGRERSTRESTPVQDSETIGICTPGSSTSRPRNWLSSRRICNTNIPTAHELDEFFNLAEQQEQRHFIEKYNFDVVNDVPLEGRYEWVRM